MVVKTHTFRGKRWKIIDTGGYPGGLCEGPHISEREMLIPATGETLTDLDTIIHEAIHACFWDIDEEVVEQVGTDIARILYRLGWRKSEV